MKILMVCLGNICRSPMAEGVLREKARVANKHIIVDSAGTSDFHIGEAPDKRAIACMKSHQIDISGLQARQLTSQDFIDFDVIYTMDKNNLKDAIKFSPDPALNEKVKLFLDHQDEHHLKVVPDPYYGTDENFEHVYELCVEASEQILAWID
ncbi:MAG: low molecular weight protein-tyrosine-phosphatase [Flavobacteriales bacterium]